MTSALLIFGSSLLAGWCDKIVLSLYSHNEWKTRLRFLEYWHIGILFRMTPTCLSDRIIQLTLYGGTQRTPFLSGGFMVCSAELIQHSSELSNVAHPLWDWPKVLVHSQLLLLFLFFFFFKFPPAALDALRNIYITPQGQIWEMKTSQRRN